MHTSTLHHPRKSIRFRFWSRKSYAVFGSLHHHVTIGSVCKGIADSALDKSKAVFSLKDNCRGIQIKAMEDEEVRAADGSLVWGGSDYEQLLGLLAGGCTARGEVHAKEVNRLFVIHKNGVTKQLQGLCTETGRVVSSLRSFYTYHYDRRTGKESR